MKSTRRFVEIESKRAVKPSDSMRSVRVLTLITFVICLISIGLSCSRASAQVDVSASLTGMVTDQTGAVVPNATVKVRNVQTEVENKTVSEGSGYYHFASLPVGTYTVTCEVKGFKTFIATEVVLHAQGAVTMPVTLQVGAASQTVSVSGSSAMVNTETADNSITIDSELIKSVPVQGRDPRESLELLTPGATAAGTGSSYFIPITSFNGVSGLSNNYNIDGAAMNDYMHGSAVASYPQSENLSELTVSSTLPDASVARGAGGQINANLKNGTDKFHGQAWSYLQSGGWNANSWSNKFQGVRRQPFTQQWYGGNIGGPVFIPRLYNGRGKTFFFVSFERTSTSKKSTSTGQTITDAERGGDFTNSPDGIPIVNGVPTPIIPTSAFSPLGQLINSSAGKTILPEPTSGTDSFTWNPSDNSLVKTWVVRIDENFNDKHRLFGSLWWYQNATTFDDLYESFSEASWATHYPNPDATWGEPISSQVWSLNDTYTISPSMLNNFILGVTRSNISVTNTWSPSHELFGASNTGIGAVGDTLSPSIQDISIPRNMGMGIYNGYVNPMTQSNLDISDNFILNKGRHTIKAGVEFRNYHEWLFQTWGSGGNVSFSDSNISVGGTGNGIADMMLAGGIGGFSQNSANRLDVNYPAREAYAQDSFKLKPSLTVMLGIRWEPHFGVQPVQPTFVTFRPGQQSTVFPTAPTGLVAIGDRGIPQNTYGTRWGDLGPRASFAWDILGKHKAVLRGGYGLYPNYQVLLGFTGYATTAPYGLQYYPNIQTLDLANPYNQYGTTPFPYVPPLPGAPGNNTIQFQLPVNNQAISKDYNAAAIHKFETTFEFEPINTYVLSVSWLATRGTHLDESQNFNWPRFVPGGSTNTVANVYSREPYYSVGFNTITMDSSDWNSMYHALQVAVNKRMSHGLTLMGNYTFSNSWTQHGCRYQADCGLDYYSPGTTSAMAAAFRYQIPTFMNQNRMSREILGGWALGSTMSASTGAYGSLADYNCNEFTFGSAGCYANYTGGDALLANRKQAAADSSGKMIGVTWVDPSKFVRGDQVSVGGVATTLPGVGQQLYLGNAIVGVIKGPAQGLIVNGSLDKDFQIVESFKLNFHAEAFNAFNHTVLGAPGYNNTVGPNTQGFGIISSAAAPRNIQLSLHLIF